MTLQPEQPFGEHASLADIAERLIADGAIQDAAAARHRITLGFPPWLVLQELTPQRLLDEMAQSTGLPILAYKVWPELLDHALCREIGPERLLQMRWAPLIDGRVAIANPFRGPVDEALSGRQLVLASSREIDGVLESAFPGQGAGLRNRRRLGRFLLDAGAVNEEQLATALAEQGLNGGRLGEILLSHGLVDSRKMTQALAERAGITTVGDGAQALPLLPRSMAHELRAVAIESVAPGDAAELQVPVVVAFSDPSPHIVWMVEDELGRTVDARAIDDETLDALLAAVYAQADMADVVGSLQQRVPHLSAQRTGLSRPQSGIVLTLALVVLAGFVLSTMLTGIIVVAVGTLIYVFYTLYRLYSAWKGWRLGSTINPSPEELAAMDGRELPSYTVLLPVFREKPQTMRALFQSLSDLDYPKQKLNGLLLLESDDEQTLTAVREVEAESPGIRPGWLKTLLIPPGEPRTKPKAMIYGLLYSGGDLLTIFDAEDKPEPDQLKKAAWAFARAGDNVACIQAKLSYYNSRQNLLTRWFTLEYAAWFDLFLPGLHAMGAPIPLGGTSNHFRLNILKDVFSWDPYNVTEDADLGLRFSRAGYRTQMLESTTFEEANSRYRNWLRQRSRWIKGYMQTFLVHTRNPLRLYREIGLINSLHFLATVGGLIYTVVVSPLFWSLLALWLLFQPGWIPELFPGPIYYLAMASLVFGNFFFVFLALIGAVGRGQDDLSPYTLLFPVYWLMMSVAAYLALYELVRKPHYWQKTEHGLHLEPAPEEGAGGSGLPYEESERAA